MSSPRSRSTRRYRAALPVTAALVATLLAPSATTQAVLVPSQAQQGIGNRSAEALLFGNASLGWPGLRVQMIYAGTELPAGPRVIRSLRLRRDAGRTTNHAVTVQTTIRMSNSPRDPAITVADFAGNHGPDVTTVFQGTINMPARPAPASWPASWEAPITLQTPFTFAGAPGSLVVDFATTGNDSSGSWRIEAYDVDQGVTTADYVQTGCESSTGSVASGYVDLGHLVPGGDFRVGFSPYPSREPLLHTSFVAIGAQGVGSGRTPIRLDQFGVPASPGCRWAIDIHAVIPATYYQPPTGVSHPSLGQVGMPTAIPIPSDPSLAGIDLYSQALSTDRDPQTGTPRLLASLALRHRIGDGRGPAAALVSSRDHLATTGAVRLNRAGTLLLD